MPKTWDTDFTVGKDAIKGWKQTDGSLTYTSEGAEFVIAKKGDAPTIGSEAYLHFGYVEVTMKAASGQGIISSIVLESDDLDEVDWEWIGGVDSKVQMNYFGKGNTTTYDRVKVADVANNQNDFHTYALNWTAESLTWLIDGIPMRTLNYADANGGKNYPQTPCNVRLGNWPGGDSENKGTRDWAGGVVDYTKAPFTMTVKSVKVINYSPGTEYKYTDMSGDFKSIEVIGAGNAAGASQNSVVIASSATATAVPLASDVNAPTASGEVGQGNGSTQSTAVPVSGGESNFSYPSSGSVPQTSAAAASPPINETPSTCGIATVTVTGAPPPGILTSGYSAVPMSSLLTLISSAPLASSVQVPIVSSATPAQPPITPVVSPPLYPTTGLAIDTRSAPSVPYPSAPTGALPRPSGNATVSGPPAQFTGASTRNTAGILAGVLAGAVLLVC